MKTPLLLSIFFNLIFSTLYSQNLVVNGGAELLKKNKISKTESYRLCEGMSSPTNGTPDFFHPKAYQIIGRDKPYSLLGSQKPYRGDGCFGLAAFAFINNKEYPREYMQLELSQPLIKGSVYHLEFYVLLSFTQKISASGFGICFSDSLVYFSSKDMQGRKYLDLETNILSDSAFLNTRSWKKVTSSYLASGGEKYIVLGNFLPRNNVNITEVPGYKETPYGSETSYTLIDEILIEEKTPFHELLNNENVSIDNIEFDQGKSIIKKESVPIILKLSNFLLNHMEFSINIIGHTDNSGNPDDNLKLSLQRAESIKNVLISEGISSSRFICIGKGDSQPIASNETTDGKQKNRRVELSVIKE